MGRLLGSRLGPTVGLMVGLTVGLPEPCGERVGWFDGEADGHSPQLTLHSAMISGLPSGGLQYLATLANRVTISLMLNSVSHHDSSFFCGSHGSAEVVVEVVVVVVEVAAVSGSTSVERAIFTPPSSVHRRRSLYIVGCALEQISGNGYADRERLPCCERAAVSHGRCCAW